MSSCPCCGHPLPDNKLRGVHLTPMQNRIFDLISRRSPSFTHVDTLMDLVYGNDPGGGPGDVNVMRQHVKNINKRLNSVGLYIRNQYGYGYRLVEQRNGQTQ